MVDAAGKRKMCGAPWWEIVREIASSDESTSSGGGSTAGEGTFSDDWGGDAICTAARLYDVRQRAQERK